MIGIVEVAEDEITRPMDTADEDAMVHSMAIILHQMIEQTDGYPPEKTLEDPFYCPSNTQQVGVDQMYRFMKDTCAVAQWPLECNVHALVLITRLRLSGFPVTWANWNRIMMVGLLIAQKMVDDLPLTNLDFPQLWAICAPNASAFTAVQLSKMELTFIKLIKWETHVTRQVYMQFSCELRDLAQQNVQLCESTAFAQTDEMVGPEVTSEQPSASWAMCTIENQLAEDELVCESTAFVQTDEMVELEVTSEQPSASWAMCAIENQLAEDELTEWLRDN
jgi:hypothetical protein